MKAFVITLALAGLVSAATVDAQILGSRLPTTSASVGGSWRVVGRDGNGNTIYERRTQQDQYGNIIVQRARRDDRGNMSIISSNTVGNNTSNRNSRNCDYTRTTNSISDMIFNRSNDVNCDDNGNRVDNGWYQVGRGRDNNSIYERRTRVNGRPVIQRARRDSRGRFMIISTRPANDNDKQWQKEQKQQDKEWKKQQKQQDKEYKKSQRGNDNENGNYRNDSYRNDNSVYRGSDNSYRNNSAVAKGNGRGKDNGKENGKENGKGKHKDKG